MNGEYSVNDTASGISNVPPAVNVPKTSTIDGSKANKKYKGMRTEMIADQTRVVRSWECDLGVASPDVPQYLEHSE